MPYQTTHNTGGAIMGADPDDQRRQPLPAVWDVPNVFVMGARVFPQNAGYNPTGTVGALAYWAADAIRQSLPEEPRAAGAGLKRGTASCAHRGSPRGRCVVGLACR